MSLPFLIHLKVCKTYLFVSQYNNFFFVNKKSYKIIHTALKDPLKWNGLKFKKVQIPLSDFVPYKISTYNRKYFTRNM